MKSGSGSRSNSTHNDTQWTIGKLILIVIVWAYPYRTLYVIYIIHHNNNNISDLLRSNFEFRTLRIFIWIRYSKFELDFACIEFSIAYHPDEILNVRE